MGEQRSHAQPGVRGQDTKLNLQLRGDTLRSILHPLEQFPTDLKAERIGDDELCVQLRSYVDTVLDDRESRIIKLRYGLDTGAPKTQRETADLLGISRSYVSRIEKKALEKLNQCFDER